MSTKTLRKRIALVAVSAMGFGLLTSVGANAAAANNTNIAWTAASTQPGVCSVAAGDTTSTTGYPTAYVVTGTSIVLNDDSTNAGGGTTSTYLAITGNATFTGGATNSTFGAGGYETLTSTTAFDDSRVSTNTLTVKAGAVGTATISYGLTDSSTPLTKAVLNIVASCDNATFSSADSYFQATTDGTTADSNTDETTSGLPATTIANGSPGYISMLLKDVYGSTLPAGKALVVTVKSGDAYANITAGNASGTPNSKTGIATSNAAATAGVKVVQATANTPTTAVVEVTYNGVVVGTRTFTFEGPASKINVSDVTVGKKGSYGYYRYTITDAAGNPLRSKSIAADSLVTDGVIVVNAASATGSTTVLGDKSDTPTGASPAKFLCGTAKTGKGTVGLKYTDSDTLATIKASFDAYCGGALDTWSISMDKASYAPGEIATLTVSGKDSSGNVVNATDTIGTVEYSFGGMTFVTAPTTTDSFASAAGAKTYKLTVGTTEGSFVGTFKITGTTDDTAKTVTYKVASTSATVSSNEVLAAIVKLIASINKQIVALQKLILKKK